ncbi:uncharacterized protein BDV14DRAFT_174328 [Aspergillus stella-maris]|uniref:uncharacterized protein n=1 Tax=Aspergillus stella-maris TaxID=1810926 RepID=UPI003CCC93A3
MSKKPLGRSSGSLNAPIAAFTMAVVLCSYCVYSIGAARRGTASQHSQAQADAAQRRMKSEGWVARALEEQSREKEVGRK